MKAYLIFAFSILGHLTLAQPPEVPGEDKKEYYPDGKLKSQGKMVNGMKEGIWKYYYPSQIVSAEECYREDLLHGKRRTYDFEGKLQTLENWMDGVEEDSSFSFYANGQVHRKGVYHDGLYEGLWNTYYENGTLKNQGSYRLGNPDGWWTFWNEEGVKTFEGKYVNGKQEGVWKEYNEEKKYLQFEGEYKNGIKTGTWKEYNSKGKVKRTFAP